MRPMRKYNHYFKMLQMPFNLYARLMMKIGISV